MSLWTMKDVIRMTGTTENALRYYNAKGVLPPTRQEAGGRRQWLYDDAAVGKLKRLLLLKYIGLSVEDAGIALEDEAQCRKLLMETLERLQRERDRSDRKMFIARTLAVSFGEEMFPADEELDEAKAAVLNELVRELIVSEAREREDPVPAPYRECGTAEKLKQSARKLR